MLNFLTNKSKIQTYNFVEISPADIEVLGIAQVNPYCEIPYDNSTFFTVVNFSFEKKQFDEREGLVLSNYFTLRRCPRCKKVQLIPSKLRINCDSIYLKNEEEIAFDAFEENPPLRHFPSTAWAYCNACSACFEMRIKTKDLWVKQAKKLKNKDLITKHWDEYTLN